MDNLTSRQQEILDFIRQFSENEGMPPTRADLCRHMGFRSPNAAESHLRALAKKGALELIPGSSRGIRLPELEAANDPGLPLIGRVAAGEPILAVEHVESRYDVAPHLFQPHADYLLRVRGESMRDVGILDGDLLAVHSTSEARNGQIVVARVEDEVTVKRYQRKGHQLTLLAENPDFAPIEVDLREQQVTIEGLGVGVLRTTT